MKIEVGVDHKRDTASSSSSTICVGLNPENIVVGLSEDVRLLIDRLTSRQSKLDVIQIVGMGGIGKSTLARALYNDDQFFAYHFDRRAWVTISQNYEIREILLALLRCIIDKETMIEMIREQDNEKLSLKLYQILTGRRYLIVLDDVWSFKAWDDLKRFFPENENNSRIIMTTRVENVADYASSGASHHRMMLLNVDDSWNLLHHKVFSGETCPKDLEGIGERIAKDCKGLPLAIHVVGGILSQLRKTPQSWEQVAKDVRAAVAANKDEQMSNILSLSYNHLPIHLKPCFLYLSVFPEDYEIRASKVIKLWVAEGFLKPCLGKTLEEAAQAYLKDLAGRNLVLVSQEDVGWNVKSYILHDLVRDLCIKKAEEEKFLCVKRSSVISTNIRRASFHRFARIKYTITSTNLTRSLICFDGTSSNFRGMQLLRVLDVYKTFFKGSKIGKLMNIRYLAFCVRGELPSSLFALRNLRTLILNGRRLEGIQSFPPIDRQVKFDMPRLRHLKFKEWYPICDIPVVLEDLQTLSTVNVDDSFQRLVEAVPNLKKLGIYGDGSARVSSLIDLSRLKKLETLKCLFVTSSWNSSLLPRLIFPPSLKKLVIRTDKIPPELMIKIGRELPNLEVLKLVTRLWRRLEWEWEPVEGELCYLRVLQLEGLQSEKWIADETHYPRLQRLIIRSCNLEIPSAIGDIPTLELLQVQVYKLSSRTVDSAKKIQDQQLELGNEDLKVRIIKLQLD